MRYLIIILLLFSCNNKQDNVKSFEDYLGKDKAESLNLAISAWDNFVNINRGSKSVTDFSKGFLKKLMLMDSWDSLDKWSVDCKQFEKVIDEINETDLRKEFWMYSNETYDDNEVIQYYMDVKFKDYSNEPFDTIKHNDDFEEILAVPESEDNPIKFDEPRIRRQSSLHSRIISGIHKYCNEEVIRQGAEITIEVGNLSPNIVIGGLLENKERVDFSSYFTKAYIVQTIFYDFMNSNTCKNSK
ncbi:hypothetical protein J0A67_22565 [Algoriphagus aestuariicola]|uniref:Uncharacterized protein n=1 Tax=Algoriphagus aestuariicola TaxID=1852016 RepID=A0ABS3BWI8_9BACT|nr:hypothetical protein [Algoriphagus aestuariicola]MBN7803664.1 hypothetical protein [Algoriphagus aestuariicola]